MKFRHSFLLITLICIVLLVTGCGKKEKLPQEVLDILNSTSKTWLKLGVYGDPLSLNPIGHIESEHGQMVCNFVHASPLRKMPDGTFVPYLFDSYSIYPGSSSDTIIMEAVWKNNLKWHDGSDFDPKDLEFTFDLIRKSENSSPYFDLLKGVENITSFGRGQRTRIVFAYNSRKLLDLLTVGIVPSHIIKDSSLEKATVPVEGVSSESWPLYVDQPVGLGPFKIKAREKGRFLEMVPSEFFFDNASRSSVLVMTSYDYQQLVSDFRSGRLAWINLPSMLAEQLETMKIENTLFIDYPNPACMVWLFNTKNSLMSEKKLRLALDLLADRKKIGNDVPFAGETLYEAPFASGTTAVADYTSRFAMALDLLDSLGWKDSDSDGIRDQAGKKLEIKIAFNEDNLLRRALAEKFSEDCKRAGINLVLQPVSWAELVSSHLKKGDFETALVSFKFPEFGNLDAFFHSRSINDASATVEVGNARYFDDKLNFSGVSDPELDKTLEELDSMLDMDNVVEKRAFVASYLRDVCPAAFLFKPYDVGLYHSESGKSVANSAIWNDVLNWKVLFGPADSKL